MANIVKYDESKIKAGDLWNSTSPYSQMEDEMSNDKDYQYSGLMAKVAHQYYRYYNDGDVPGWANYNNGFRTRAYNRSWGEYSKLTPAGELELEKRTAKMIVKEYARYLKDKEEKEIQKQLRAYERELRKSRKAAQETTDECLTEEEAPVRNPNFDENKFGKFFDEEGKLIPELANEYFATVRKEIANKRRGKRGTSWNSMKEGAEGKREPGYEYVIYDYTDEDLNYTPIVAIRSTKTEAEYTAMKWMGNDYVTNKAGHPKYKDRLLTFEKVPKGKFKVGDNFYGPFDSDWNKMESLEDQSLFHYGEVDELMDEMGSYDDIIQELMDRFKIDRETAESWFDAWANTPDKSDYDDFENESLKESSYDPFKRRATKSDIEYINMLRNAPERLPTIDEIEKQTVQRLADQKAMFGSKSMADLKAVDYTKLSDRELEMLLSELDDRAFSCERGADTLRKAIRKYVRGRKNESLNEDFPSFWEWVNDMGLDSDYVEENPDVEDYYRQQYVTFNFKKPEDYDKAPFILDQDITESKRTRRHMIDKDAVDKLVKHLEKEGKHPSVEEREWNRAGLKRTEYDVSYDLDEGILDIFDKKPDVTYYAKIFNTSKMGGTKYFYTTIRNGFGTLLDYLIDKGLEDGEDFEIVRASKKPEFAKKLKKGQVGGARSIDKDVEKAKAAEQAAKEKEEKENAQWEKEREEKAKEGKLQKQYKAEKEAEKRRAKAADERIAREHGARISVRDKEKNPDYQSGGLHWAESMSVEEALSDDFTTDYIESTDELSPRQKELIKDINWNGITAEDIAEIAQHISPRKLEQIKEVKPGDRDEVNSCYEVTFKDGHKKLCCWSWNTQKMRWRTLSESASQELAKYYQEWKDANPSKDPRNSLERLIQDYGLATLDEIMYNEDEYQAFVDWAWQKRGVEIKPISQGVGIR